MGFWGKKDPPPPSKSKEVVTYDPNSETVKKAMSLKDPPRTNLPAVVEKKKDPPPTPDSSQGYVMPYHDDPSSRWW